MNSDLYFEGKKYISARRAAQMSGYSTDYIGQLCRAKNLESKMVGRGWFVSESSLLDYQNSFSEIQKKDSSSSSIISEPVSSIRKVDEFEAGKKDEISSSRDIRDSLNSPSQFIYSHDDKPLIPKLKNFKNESAEIAPICHSRSNSKDCHFLEGRPQVSPMFSATGNPVLVTEGLDSREGGNDGEDNNFENITFKNRRFQRALRSGKTLFVLSAIVLGIFFMKDNSQVKSVYEESAVLVKELSQNTVAGLSEAKNYLANIGAKNGANVFAKLSNFKLLGEVEESSVKNTPTDVINNISSKIYDGANNLFSSAKNYFAGFFGGKNKFAESEIVPIKKSFSSQSSLSYQVESSSSSSSGKNSISKSKNLDSLSPRTGATPVDGLRGNDRVVASDITRREVLDLIKQYDDNSKSLIYTTNAITGASSLLTNQSLSDLKNKINSLEQKESLVPRQIDHVYNSISRSFDDITSLDGVTMTNSSFSGTTGTFTGVFSGTSGTFSSSLTIGSQLTVSGTATSTLAGDTNFDSGTLYIDSINNRVGIASSSPSETLSVNGATYFSQISAPANTTDRLYNASGDLYWNGTVIGSASVGNWTSSGGNVYRSSGNVGIGTTSPYAKLSVVGETVAEKFTATSTTATSTFAGALTIGSGGETNGLVNINQSFGIPSLRLNLSGFSHGLTSVDPANSFGRLDAESANGGVYFNGITTATDDSAFIVHGIASNTLDPGVGAVVVVGSGRSGTDAVSLSSTETIFAINNNWGPNLFNVLGSGKIGIGTTTPNWNLSVAGTGSFDDFVRASYFTATSTTATSTFAGGMNVAGTSGLTVLQNGNVGIGTTSPSYKLVVSGNSSDKVAIVVNNTSSVASTTELVLGANSTATAWTLTSDAERNGTDSFSIWGGGSGDTRFYINSSGNIGIGTTSPYAKLTVWSSGTSGARIFEAIDSASTTVFSISDSGIFTYGKSATSTIPSNTNYAWSIATSTTASPIFSISTQGSGANINATTTINGGLNLDNGALTYDYSSGITTINSLEAGPMNFDNDAGIVSWIDLDITSSSAVNDNHSYTAQIDSNPVLTVYGESDGVGTTKNLRVGIGTTTPQNKLTIHNATTTADADLGFTAISTGLSSFYNWTMGIDISDAGKFKIASSTALGASDRLVINGIGNVGIGTTSPNWNLSVAGKGSFDDFVRASYFTATSTTATSTFSGGLSVAGSSGLTVLQNGNVGVGTNSPTTSFSVKGDHVSGIGIGSFKGNAGLGYVTFDTTTSDPGSLSGFVFKIAGTKIGELSSLVDNNSMNIYNNIFSSSPIMTFSSSGNVGIGTTSPYAKLSVVGQTVAEYFTATSTSATSTFAWGIQTTALNVTSTTATSTFANGIQLSKGCFQMPDGTCAGTGSGTVTSVATNNGLTGGTITTSGTIGLNTAGFLTNGLLTWDGSNLTATGTPNLTVGYFTATSTIATSTFAGGMNVAGTAGLTVLQNGKVGVGTASPIYPLEVRGSSAPVIRASRDTSSTNAMVTAFGALGISSGDMIDGFGTALSFGIQDNAAVINTIGYIGAVRDGADDSGQLQLVSTNAGASVVAMVVKPSGNIGIGTTSPWRMLSVNGTMAVTALTAGAAGDYAVCINNTTKELTNAGATGCVVSSKRFKENISALDSGLHELMQLKPSKFTYIGQTGEHMGLIAEDVNEIDPRLVEYEADGVTPRTVRYMEISALLIKSIQELNLNLATIASTAATTTPKSQSFADTFFSNIFARVAGWLADATNGIEKLFAKEVRTGKLCLDDVCVTKTELQALLQNASAGGSSASSSSVSSLTQSSSLSSSISSSADEASSSSESSESSASSQSSSEASSSESSVSISSASSETSSSSSESSSSEAVSSSPNSESSSSSSFEPEPTSHVGSAESSSSSVSSGTVSSSSSVSSESSSSEAGI